MNLQFFPVTGSLIPGVLILAMLAAVVVYGWWSDEHSHRRAERSAFKRAA